jgi:tripartite tricarboxylate transporter TctB family protein
MGTRLRAVPTRDVHQQSLVRAGTALVYTGGQITVVFRAFAHPTERQMFSDSSMTRYWRDEFALIAFLLLFFTGIVAFSYDTPFDARLFPLIIGGSGIVLMLLVGIEQARLRRIGKVSLVNEDDPAAKADWPRHATALLSAPVFGLAFWLFGFVVASLAAMLVMPLLMGYRNRRRLVLVAVVTVAVLALICPYLLKVDLPHGLLGDWLIDKLALRPG